LSIFYFDIEVLIVNNLLHNAFIEPQFQNL